MLQQKVFKDLNITFAKSPVTKDLMVTKDSVAIKRSVMNLILTNPGERLFNLNIGCKVRRLLFDPLDFITASTIKSEIEYTIRAFEPRVNLKAVDVEIDEDNNGFNVIIDYTVLGNALSVQSIDIFLERSRA